MKKYPTPTARDWKDTPGSSPKGVNPDGSERDRTDRLAINVYESASNPSGQLSPDWVEWLMGWPIGWTRLEPIELDERGWETDPADGDAQHMWATPSANKTTKSGEIVNADGTPWNGISKPHSKNTGEPIQTALSDQVATNKGANTGDIPRVATGIKARTDRLKAIGNGQVPQAAELAWRILTQ